MANFEKSTTHPSYGTITLSRVTSSHGMNLFGSSIKHNSCIALRINRAELIRDYNADRAYGNDQIIEIRMSPVQFAEFVMSAGIGEGTPCTISWLKDEGMIPPPIGESKREQFVNEFAEDVVKVGKRLDAVMAKLDTMVEQPSVSKAERKELREMVRMARQDIVSNMPFVARQFNEQMDKTVHEAKGEVEAFVSGVIQRSGLDAIKRGQISLE